METVYCINVQFHLGGVVVASGGMGYRPGHGPLFVVTSFSLYGFGKDIIFAESKVSLQHMAVIGSRQEAINCLCQATCRQKSPSNALK